MMAIESRSSLGPLYHCRVKKEKLNVDYGLHTRLPTVVFKLDLGLRFLTDEELQQNTISSTSEVLNKC